MKAYYGSRISPNMTETNEGYLVCHNVPIARTGKYEYLGSEIGADTNDVVPVFRDGSEVFSPAAMSSFNGKPVTDDHPPVAVDPDNVRDYQRGVVTNVRQGKGADADLLLADLIIHDQCLIDEIRQGKREVSSGYDCDYVPNGDGTYHQERIVGNHVAVVESGRAGHRVRINDSVAKDDDPDAQAEIAAKKYHISVKQDGHRSPPEGYPKDREQYADPVNYKYPLDGARKHAAVDYYNDPEERTKGGYSPDEWKVIGRRIVASLGSGYELQDGHITTPEERAKTKVRDSRMGLKKALKNPVSATKILIAEGWRSFVQDAEPEDIVEAMDVLAEEARDEEGGNDFPVPTTQETKGKAGASVDEAPATQGDDDLKKEFAELKELVMKALAGKAKDEKTAEETLDEELKKLGGDNEEESQTVEPEEMTEDEDGVVLPPDERPTNPITGDASAKRAVLQSIKPILASIPDEKTRKQVVDAAIASFKGRSGANVYGQMARDTKARVRGQQKTAKSEEAKDFSELGMEIARKHNPHYNKTK